MPDKSFSLLMNSWLKNWSVKMLSFYIHIPFSLQVNKCFQLRRKKLEIYAKAKQAGRSHFPCQQLAPLLLLFTPLSALPVAALGTVRKNVWEEIKVKNTNIFGCVLSTD